MATLPGQILGGIPARNKTLQTVFRVFARILKLRVLRDGLAHPELALTLPGLKESS